MNPYEPYCDGFGMSVGLRPKHILGRGRPYNRHAPSIEGESIAGGWGRARGLVGGVFMGAMLAQQSESVPYLRRVAYLTGNSNQYIDTNLNVLDFDYLKIKYKANTLYPTGEHYCFGVWAGTTEGSPAAGMVNGLVWVKYGNYRNKTITYNNTWNECVIWIGDGINNGIYVDGNKVDDCPSTAMRDAYNSHTMPIFARKEVKGGFDWARSGNFSISEFMLSRNGEELIHFYPVLDLSGRPAMFDDVSGQLYYNQGSGEFTWGEL